MLLAFNPGVLWRPLKVLCVFKKAVLKSFSHFVDIAISAEEFDFLFEKFY